MTRKNFKYNRIKRVIVILMAVVMSFSMFSGCDKKETTIEYDSTAGINYEKPIAKLVVKNQTSYKIVIPTQATESETYAATELQDFIYQSTGVKINIVKDEKVKLKERCISIGNTKLFNESEIELGDLNLDGFIIKTVGETVLIKGERDAGTLMGVYDFLEKFLDIKFLSVDNTYIPDLSEIKLYECDITEKPTFSTRFYHGALARSNQPAVVRLRLSVNNESGQWASRTKFGGLGQETACNFHSYEELCPYSLSSEHPEWFSHPTNGEHPQPSLANGMTDDGEIDETMEESVLKTVIESVKQRLLARPEARLVPLGQNDSNAYAETDADNRQRTLFGGQSGQSIVFTNAVAKAVDEWLAETDPDRKVEYFTFAYGPTLDAPDQTAPKATLAVPRDNVYVMYAPLQAMWNIPLMDSRNVRTADPIKGIEAWRKITDNFYMYDYTTNFNNYLSWYPILPVLKTNVELYADMGVEFYVSEGLMNGYQNELKIYVLSKLMWNKDRDVNKLISEYNKYTFGETAGKVMDDFVFYSDLHFEEIAGEGDERKLASIYDVGSSWLISVDTLSVDFVRRAESYVINAKEIIENDTEISQKLRSNRLDSLSEAEAMIDMMKYLNYDQLWKTTEAEKEKFLRSFYDRVKKMPITSFGVKTWGTVVQEFAKHGIY